MRPFAARLLPVAVVLALGCGANKLGNSDAGSDAGADGGSDAGVCESCFLHGQWQLANLSPCFVTSLSTDGGPDQVTAVLSTSLQGGAALCPSDPTSKPTEPWSTDTLTIDCPGHYRLCMTLKAGSAQSPQASDCTMAQACAEGDASSSSAAQSWPPVDSFIANSGPALACAQQFYESGGYGEMGVTGIADACGSVSRVFNRVQYCALTCNSNPSGANCTNCGSGNGGTF